MPIFIPLKSSMRRRTRRWRLPFLATMFSVCAFSVFASDKPRVISLSPAITEIIFQLGKGDSLIGRSDICDYPPDALKIPVAGSFGKPVLETVIRLHPDLLIANSFINPQIAQTLAPFGIETVILPSENIADYRRVLAILGEKLSARDAAQKEETRLDNELTQFSALPPIDANMLAIVWDAPLMVAGQKSLLNEAMRLAKIRNIAEFPVAYYKCSFEWILRNQPDFLLWTPPFPIPPSQSFWQELSAVKNQRVFTDADFDFDCLQRASPRFFNGVRDLRTAIERKLRDND